MSRSENAACVRVHRWIQNRYETELTHSRKAWAIPRMASGGPCSTCCQNDDEVAERAVAEADAEADADADALEVASRDKLSATATLP
jgi:hypothetical protein